VIKWVYVIVGLAALAGAAGVAEAAVAAHRIADPLLKTSADTLIVSAAATIGIGCFALVQTRIWALAGAALLIGGSLLFCGELSVHVLAGHKIFGAAAPIGGLAMIAGWLIVSVDAFAAAMRSVGTS
jgi:uncharacterized membrane protein YgdD (TMEM256/DUF423 family)